MNVERNTRSKGKANPIDIHVGSRIRLRRTMLGYSQEKLADALGVTFQQVQKYENGANRVGASRLFQTSKVLGVSVSFFFDGYDEAPANSQQKVSEDRKDMDDLKLGNRETIELVRSYYNIEDPSVRKKVFEMVKTLSKTQSMGKENTSS